MARPLMYIDTTTVRLRPDGTSKLQPNSDRRAIVNLILENGGMMTLLQIDEAFACSVRSKVIALVRAGWLEIAA